ncbi:MAG: nucleotide exchange factor GrpE, partial [Actinobacteria bacterium]|nr:nucleotide exchange factor GrpE [Actinomycetota bacterium]
MLAQALKVVDSVERALQMGHGTPAADGMRALLDQMEAILARHGAQRIGAEGPFDPERHEAITVRATSDAPDRSVLE